MSLSFHYFLPREFCTVTARNIQWIDFSPEVFPMIFFFSCTLQHHIDRESLLHFNHLNSPPEINSHCILNLCDSLNQTYDLTRYLYFSALKYLTEFNFYFFWRYINNSFFFSLIFSLPSAVACCDNLVNRVICNKIFAITAQD